MILMTPWVWIRSYWWSLSSTCPLRSNPTHYLNILPKFCNIQSIRTQLPDEIRALMQPQHHFFLSNSIPKTLIIKKKKKAFRSSQFGRKRLYPLHKTSTFCRGLGKVIGRQPYPNNNNIYILHQGPTSNLDTPVSIIFDSKED